MPRLTRRERKRAVESFRTFYIKKTPVPRTRTTRLGRWSFFITAPVVWNSLPLHLRSPSISRSQFQAGLKTHLFRLAFHWCFLWELLKRLKWTELNWSRWSYWHGLVMTAEWMTDSSMPIQCSPPPAVWVANSVVARQLSSQLVYVTQRTSVEWSRPPTNMHNQPNFERWLPFSGDFIHKTCPAKQQTTHDCITPAATDWWYFSSCNARHSSHLLPWYRVVRPGCYIK